MPEIVNFLVYVILTQSPESEGIVLTKLLNYIFYFSLFYRVKIILYYGMVTITPLKNIYGTCATC